MDVLWSDDFSERSLEDVIASIVENRAWAKSLRERTTALVETRLAKTITKEEYDAGRQRATDDSAECKRRKEILCRDLDKREKGRPLSMPSLRVDLESVT
jgi:hypothetical protein